MLTVSRIAASLLLLFSVFQLTFLAQERATESRSAPVVTATVTAKRARFTAASNTVAMRLEVYTADGQRLFDSGFKSGTLLDWTMTDEQGQHYPAGTYLCVVAIKSLSGRVSQKLGTLSISAEGAASLKPTETTQLSAAQRQALNGAENSSALNILREGEATATTSIANTGTEGVIARGKGALSFRLGDFYSGKDVEQMRLTKEGNLGIGTENPQARLDVNGVVRAQEGIQFGDGTLLNLSAKGELSVTSPSGNTSSFNATTSSLSGTGTQNRLAKWTDSSGTLGNSSIFEDASGNVGIGTTTPGARLQVNGNQFIKPLGATPTYKVLAGSDPTKTVMLTTDSGNFGWQLTPAKSATETMVQVSGQTFATAPNRGEFGVYLGANSNSAFKVIRRGGDELMRVNRSGNVGIGTNAPTSKLDVAGDIRVSSTGSGLIFPDGTKQTTASGGQMTGTSIVSAINDPATTGTISDNRLPANVARLNSANTFTGNQTVTGNLSVGGTGNGLIFPDGTKQTTAVDGGSYIQNTTVKQVNSSFNISGNGTAGGELSARVVNALFQFNIGGSHVLSASGGANNLFIGANPTHYIASRNRATFVGSPGSHITGNDNTVVGSNAGTLISSTNYPVNGEGITLIGAAANADPTSNFPSTNATAIGARAFVSQSNSLVLGSINGVNGASNDTLVGIGTHAPQFRLHVIDPSTKGLRVQTNGSGGTVASFGGFGEFQVDAPGTSGGRFVVKENGNVGIGLANPNNRLDVNGMISFSQLGAAGSTALCLNSSNQISSCSSSLRYKTNVANFSGGLTLIDRLRPVTFDWKESKAHDLGLVAEEVAAVEPLLALRNKEGEIEGVKYDRLNVVLINAVKEQQAQIKSQADALAALQKENLEMKRRLASLEQSLRQPR